MSSLSVPQRLQTYTNDYKAPTVHASDTWRIVAIALFFGLLIAFSLICGVLALLDRTPRTLAAFTLGLWVIVGIVILLGAGGDFHSAVLVVVGVLFYMPVAVSARHHVGCSLQGADGNCCLTELDLWVIACSSSWILTCTVGNSLGFTFV